MSLTILYVNEYSLMFILVSTRASCLLHGTSAGCKGPLEFWLAGRCPLLGLYPPIYPCTNLITTSWLTLSMLERIALFLTCSGQNRSCHISKNSPCAQLNFLCTMPFVKMLPEDFAVVILLLLRLRSVSGTQACTSESTLKFRCFSPARTTYTKLSRGFHAYGVSDEFQGHVLSQHFQLPGLFIPISYGFHAYGVSN